MLVLYGVYYPIVSGDFYAGVPVPDICDLTEEGQSVEWAFPGLYDHPLQRNSREKLVFRKSAVSGHFEQIRPFTVAESGQNCQKAHLHAKTFIWGSFLYEAPAPYSKKNIRWTDGRTDAETDTFGLGPNIGN